MSVFNTMSVRGDSSAMRYKMVRTIARQKHCDVVEAIDLPSDRTVALKIYDLTRMSLLQRAHLRREISIHLSLNHKHIVKLYDVYYPDEMTCVLVIEYCDGGNLYEHLLKLPETMTEKEVIRNVLCPIASALKYIHALGIIHRDIKLDNVLLHQGKVKIADFGVAINALDERPVTRVGTLTYLSPEVLACPLKRQPNENKDNFLVGGYTTRVDIWSVGVLLYECLNMASPYATGTREETIELIKAASLPKFIVSNVSNEMIELVHRCLSLDPFMRPSAKDLLVFTWGYIFKFPLLRKSSSSL